MKTNIITIFLTLYALHTFGQIKFENGYFIDNNNKRIECLIKNIDWRENPEEFKFKITADANIEIGSLKTAKEFGIIGFSRYVRADTKIDLSPADLNDLSKSPDPEWAQVQLFLKVLLEGKAILYYYEKKDLIRFFYSLSDTLINQLVYKKYYVNGDQIAENFKFREQLWNYVRWPNAGMNSVENLRFNNTELGRYFRKYNEGEGNPSVVYSDKKKRDSFQLRFTPGLNYSWVSVANNNSPYLYTDFGNQISYRLGVEVEYKLPFNKNKWGIIFEPSYQYFNSNGQKGSETIYINYQSIEFPIGLRHSFFLNENLMIFVNAILIPSYSFDFNSTISNLEIGAGRNFAFGGGIGFKKLSGEIRYSTNRNLLKNYLLWYTDYRRFSFILGYRIN